MKLIPKLQTAFQPIVEQNYENNRQLALLEILALGHEAYWDDNTQQLKTKAGTPIEIILDKKGKKQYVFTTSKGDRLAMSANGKFAKVVNSTNQSDWTQVKFDHSNKPKHKSSGDWMRGGAKNLDETVGILTEVASKPFEWLWNGVKSSAMSGGGVPTTYATTGLYVYRTPETKREKTSKELDKVATVISPNMLGGAVRYGVAPWSPENKGLTYIEGYPGFSSALGLGLDIAAFKGIGKGYSYLNLHYYPALPEGTGVYLRLGTKEIINDAVESGVVKPEGDAFDVAYLEGTKWIKDHPLATTDELVEFVYDIKPPFSLFKSFSSNYMFNERSPFYGLGSKYRYTILGTDRPEINWRPIRHKGHKWIREPYVEGAENTMGVPTEFMEGYFTLLPFGLGQWFRRFPETKAPLEYYKLYPLDAQINIPLVKEGTYSPFSRNLVVYDRRTGLPFNINSLDFDNNVYFIHGTSDVGMEGILREGMTNGLVGIDLNGTVTTGSAAELQRRMMNMSSSRYKNLAIIQYPKRAGYIGKITPLTANDPYISFLEDGEVRLRPEFISNFLTLDNGLSVIPREFTIPKYREAVGGEAFPVSATSELLPTFLDFLGKWSPYTTLYRVLGTGVSFNPKRAANGIALQPYVGMWFTDNPEKVKWYGYNALRGKDPASLVELHTVLIPTTELNSYRAENILPRTFDFEPYEDFLIPLEIPRTIYSLPWSKSDKIFNLLLPIK